MSHVAIGRRVRVSIQDPDSFAHRAAECLNGKTGTIAEYTPISYNATDARGMPGPAWLVTFDEPAAPWWTNQLPVSSFWFAASDIAAE